MSAIQATISNMIPKLYPEARMSTQNKNSFYDMVTCDTDATISVLSLGIIQHYELQVQDTSEHLSSADGNPMTTKGRNISYYQPPSKISP